jgi:hypothetical protein
MPAAPDASSVAFTCARAGARARAAAARGQPGPAARSPAAGRDDLRGDEGVGGGGEELVGALGGRGALLRGEVLGRDPAVAGAVVLLHPRQAVVDGGELRGDVVHALEPEAPVAVVDLAQGRLVVGGARRAGAGVGRRRRRGARRLCPQIRLGRRAVLLRIAPAFLGFGSGSIPRGISFGAESEFGQFPRRHMLPLQLSLFIKRGPVCCGHFRGLEAMGNRY